MAEQQQYDITEILKILPHRYPFVLVDRILEVELGQSIKGLKNVTINEPFFPGHFPSEPVMPGVLIMEGMAQVGAILAYLTEKEKIGSSLVYFAGMDGVRFRRKVVPGDQIIYELKILKRKSKLFKIEGKAFVDDALAAEAVLMATFS
ncbi:MAG: 3-hydroxyacyl-ACP dehydratase FabZ [Desulfobulbaceae bacterium]|uniref:3-hydroxyacyl-[acyl-carrier-protein] dehydratase FabZ n=1 Tax=Candidatus Desulfobia pelagia TaxID=2841692 RepID=A0A8J6N9I8_9BACT|nr:3-hydroxyacyl-ACP dehydratase FabZ [Candidatus Desulfobia pelagia]